jgi:ATP-dependent RNA helicase DDX3X
VAASTSTFIALVSGNKFLLCGHKSNQSLSGRTARIGNIGLATSFYNESNEDIAGALVKTLLETKQLVPDFLEQYIPQAIADQPDAKLEFSDESDAEDNEDGKGDGEGEEDKPASISAGKENGKDAEATDDAGAHKALAESPPSIQPSKFEDVEEHPKVDLDSVAW